MREDTKAETLPEVSGRAHEQIVELAVEVFTMLADATRVRIVLALQVILGACRPPLALAALQDEPSIGLLLPCNVVVRALGQTTTAVEAVDPQTMVSMTDNPDLQDVADDATQRLRAALDSLTTNSAR